MRHNTKPDLKNIRRQDAIQRQEDAKLLTPKQKLAHLDAVLGIGVGAVKERARLLAQIAKQEQE